MTAKILKHKKLLIVLAVILLFIITFITTAFIIINVGEKKLKQNNIAAVDNKDNVEEYDYTADVYHNGKPYVYNDNIINILVLGIDEYVDSRKQQGQADAVYLISLDTDKKIVNIFSISRNTLASVDILDSDGKHYATEKQQICLAYAYGKSDEQSSINCAKSVSRLFYGIPINGYYTLYFDAVADIVDSVGGVEVTLLEEMPTLFSGKKVGEKVTINGKNALAFLRTRGESNIPRHKRHMAFISSFITVAKKAVSKDLSLISEMYEKLKKRSVTDIELSSAVYLVTQALDIEVKLHDVDGVSGFDGEFETFEVDEDKLYKTVIDTFYVEKK